jgi:hypothetical protein
VPMRRFPTIIPEIEHGNFYSRGLGRDGVDGAGKDSCGDHKSSDSAMRTDEETRDERSNRYPSNGRRSGPDDDDDEENGRHRIMITRRV